MNIVVNIEINTEKRFFYQAISIIQLDIIILIILITIILIKNQIRLMKIYKISIVALISDTTSKNLGIQKNIKVKAYLNILTICEIFFDLYL